MSSIITCSCSRSYSLLGFRKLKYVGLQHVPPSHGFDEINLELRNCPCGSTISHNLEAEKEEEANSFHSPHPDSHPVP